FPPPFSPVGTMPGIVSVAAKQKLGAPVCRKLMLLGDAFDSEAATAYGLTDFHGPVDDVDKEVARVVGRFKSIHSSYPGSTLPLNSPPSSKSSHISFSGLLHQVKKECPANTVPRAV